jgi:glycosyltransferase involved in cell wall biosynthesis
VKVIACPSDETGCGKYRLIWPAEALASAGHDVLIQKRPRILVNSKTDPPTVVECLLEQTDVVIFQRPGSYQIFQLIPLLHKRGVKVVVDMDDDLSCIHPRNPAYGYYDPNRDPHRNWEWAVKACDAADLVTVTTEALAERYGSHGRVAILPNCVPASFLTVEGKPNEMVTVGWAGYTGTHPEDLQVTHGAVNEALCKENARFLALGDVKSFDKLGIRNRFPHQHQEGVSMEEYPEFVSQLDIGIVPLASTSFNAAKSWLKALEYAALGVAPVVSPTPDNMRMVEAGAAYVARSPKAWLETIRSLVRDERERKELAIRAREFASTWTVEGNAWRWWQAWSTLSV